MRRIVILVVARGDAPPVFESTEHALDGIAVFIACFIVGDFGFSVGR